MATFSVTDRQVFKRCRRRWNYSSNARLNLTGVGSGPEALELGGLIHRALAEWTISAVPERTSLQLIFINHCNQRITEIKEGYKAQIGIPLNESHLESLYNVVQLGRAMMENYQTKWKSPIPDNMRFAAVEQEALIEVPGTEHACGSCINWAIANNLRPIDFGKSVNPYDMCCVECGGTGQVRHKLSMTLDGLLQDVKDRLFILERKTYGNRPSMVDLTMADQFTGYCWGVRELGIGQVYGVAYDGMWKRDKPPRGKTFDDLFLRTRIPKEDAELDAWGKNLALEINEMANNPAIYPNVPWQGCSDCNFQTLCGLELKGEDTAKYLANHYMTREIIRVQGMRNA